MKTKNPPCSLQTADFSQEINFSAKQLLAFKQLRSRAEDLSLALAVRLRVMAKSLAAACRNNQREGDNALMEHALTYTLLRHQLNVFLVTHSNGEFNAFKPVATVRRHLLTTLPRNLEICAAAKSCRVKTIEEMVALLTETHRESGDFPFTRKPLFSAPGQKTNAA
ncbi:MAG: hypothetical protein K0A93_09675 [Desulfuromonadaceae bacterium]|nr:hypothetical protein [Desulfuromonadaceae bacterium]